MLAAGDKTLLDLDPELAALTPHSSGAGAALVSEMLEPVPSSTTIDTDPIQSLSPEVFSHNSLLENPEKVPDSQVSSFGPPAQQEVPASARDLTGHDEHIHSCPSSSSNQPMAVVTENVEQEVPAFTSDLTDRNIGIRSPPSSPLSPLPLSLHTPGSSPPLECTPVSSIVIRQSSQVADQKRKQLDETGDEVENEPKRLKLSAITMEKQKRKQNTQITYSTPIQGELVNQKCGGPSRFVVHDHEIHTQVFSRIPRLTYI